VAAQHKHVSGVYGIAPGCHRKAASCCARHIEPCGMCSRCLAVTAAGPRGQRQVPDSRSQPSRLVTGKRTLSKPTHANADQRGVRTLHSGRPIGVHTAQRLTKGFAHCAAFSGGSRGTMVPPFICKLGLTSTSPMCTDSRMRHCRGSGIGALGMACAGPLRHGHGRRWRPGCLRRAAGVHWQEG
jgi:hypothetical protein